MTTEATWDIVIRRTLSPELSRVHGPDVMARLVGRMSHRDHVGKAEYGVRLAPRNGRDSLADAQDELLDALVYLENRIQEDGPGSATAAALREIQAQCLDGAIQIEAIIGEEARP